MVIDQHRREARERSLLFSFHVTLNLRLVAREGGYFFEGDYIVSGAVSAEGAIDAVGPIEGDISTTVPARDDLDVRYEILDWTVADGEVNCQVSVEAEHRGLRGKRRILLFDKVPFGGSAA